MAIRPTCDFCSQELTDFGGILFSPPDSESRVDKLHICKTCYAKLLKLQNKDGKTPPADTTTV